jgi:hypothetical protein
VDVYVRDIVFEQEWEGRKVTAVMRPLTFEDSLAIEAIDVGRTVNDSPEVKKAADMREAIEVTRAMRLKLPGYVKEFAGPVASDGSPVTIEEVCAAAYFARLVAGMAATLVRAAFPPQTPPAASDS